MQSASIQLQQFLESHVAPKAAECDYSFKTLNHLFNLMGQQGLYALSMQGEMAHAPLSKQTRFDNKAIESKVSGALSFLTSQINLSSSLIYYGKNEKLKAALLPKIFKGEMRIANAVSQLRHSDTFLTAQKTQDGFILNGTVHWLTGFEHFQQFILGFKHEDQEVFALLPFQRIEDNGKLLFTPILKVMVMQATQTVNVNLENWFVPFEHIIDTQTAGNWHQQMKVNSPILAYFYGIGKGALEVLEKQYHDKNTISLSLHQELELLREKITADNCTDFITPRVQITNCAWKCLQAAIVASKGQAMNPDSTISRLYREIVQFNALGVTPEYIEQQLQAPQSS